jgi:hypothetical protein
MRAGPLKLALGKFEARKRQQGESIAALGDDLRQMAQKARYTSSRGISP